MRALSPKNVTHTFKSFKEDDAEDMEFLLALSIYTPDPQAFQTFVVSW